MFLFTVLLGCVLCSLSSQMYLLAVDVTIYMSMQVYVMLVKMIQHTAVLKQNWFYFLIRNKRRHSFTKSKTLQCLDICFLLSANNQLLENVFFQ